MQTPAPLLSAVLIVRDEERCLDRCLASLRGVADEIVVLDTGSVDNTVAIAEAHGAAVHHLEWPNHFGRARNAALDLASGDWVLSIDADEWLEQPDGAGPALRELLADTAATIVTVGLRNLEGTTGHEVRSTVVATVRRVFRRELYRWEGAVHELPIVRPGVVETATEARGVVLGHDGYLREIFDAKDKAERNVAVVVGNTADTAYEAVSQARALFSAGKVAESIPYFEQGTATDAGEVARVAWWGLGRARILTGDFDGAHRAADELARCTPLAGVPKLLHADAHLAAGEFAEAYALLDGITDYLDSSTLASIASVATRSAMAAWRLGRTVDAEGHVLTALATEPTNPDAWQVVAHLARRRPQVAAKAAKLVRPDDLVRVVGALVAVHREAGDHDVRTVLGALERRHHHQPALVAARRALVAA